MSKKRPLLDENNLENSINKIYLRGRNFIMNQIIELNATTVSINKIVKK